MSIAGSSSIAFSSPGVDVIAGVQIKRLPPGKAFGAGDMETWAARRMLGRSGVALSVEQTAAGNWVVSLPNGKTVSGFKSRRDAWDWVRTRRRGR
jgi:hypothetical protein